MSDKINEAAAILVQARKQKDQIGPLPASCSPQTPTEAHAIQDAATKLLGETVRGWKVNAPPGQEPTRGSLLGSRVHQSPAKFPASDLHRIIIEGEIAFRFDRDLPPRDQPYTEAEVLDAVTAFPAIEMVDYRFADPGKVPPLDKIADHHSNGGFVMGKMAADWRRFDVKTLKVKLTVDGVTKYDQVMGHPLGNPLIPLVALANLMRQSGGVKTGQVATTGTCTGMTTVQPGQSVEVTFEGLGSVAATFAG